MNCFTEDQLNRISNLIREIEKLSDVEKLFLYLQLPCGKTEGKSKYIGVKSDLFSKKPDQETTQTYTWILSHLEVDPNVSLPKQEVYDEYRAFCQANRFEPLCVADFGKAMKHAFPCIKPRRLGQRGNSRYCYSGLRKKYKILPPNLPDIIEPTFCMDNDCSQAYNQIIRDNLDGYPLNCGPNINDYKAMNLKVDQNLQQNQFNSNGNNTTNFTSNDHSIKHNGDQNASSDHQRIALNASTNSIITPLTSVSLNDYDQTNSAPTNQTNQTARYNILQPPGTPDDDDYQHNYQNMLPTSRNSYNSTTVMTQANTTRGNGPTTSGNFNYQQSNVKHHRAEDETLVNNNTSTSTTLMNSNEESPQFGANVSAIQTSTASHINFINNSQMDSCASPFQSPASTPYPVMAGYNQDITDYYSDDFIRYPNY